MCTNFEQILTFYDNIIFTQRQISTTLAEMSDLSLRVSFTLEVEFEFST